MVIIKFYPEKALPDESYQQSAFGTQQQTSLKKTQANCWQLKTKYYIRKPRVSGWTLFKRKFIGARRWKNWILNRGRFVLPVRPGVC
jgi:hypothetical protein